jgi:thymidylate synthase (FAD)
MHVEYIRHCGNDLAVVNAARVSFDKESELEEVFKQVDINTLGKVQLLKLKDVKLINYLASNKHFSPFNHTFITLRVKAPIFVARQLQKHEYMPWNEVSRRYVDSEPEFYKPVWRKRADNVKQGSGEEFSEKEQHWINGGEDHNEMSLNYYQWLLDEGVAPELARIILPQSMYTEWYWSGTLKAWAKMYNLRIDPHAQWESRQIAGMCGEVISPLFPVSWKALINGSDLL